MKTSKLASRKFWFGVLGALMPLGYAELGEVSWERALLISTTVVCSYIFGEAFTDVAKVKRWSLSEVIRQLEKEEQ